MSTAESSTGRSATLPGAPPFTHQLALEAGSARLSLLGDFDMAAEPRLAPLLDRCTADAALVVVDLSAVEFLSCRALRLLLIASRRTRAMGGRFVVVRGQATVQRLFDLVGVDLAFELVDAPPDRSHLPRSWAPLALAHPIGKLLRRDARGHDPDQHRDEIAGRRDNDEAVEDLVEAERPGPRIRTAKCVHDGADDVEDGA